MSFSALATIIILAIGVSMDAFAVSVTNGLCYKDISTKKMAFATALTFGLFQGIMPSVGFFAGTFFRGFVEEIDHWIALILLTIIGGKMIYDAIKELRSPESCPVTPFTAKSLLLQGFATSIDALAVGIGLSMDNINIFIAAPIIAVATFTFSFIGVFIGKKFGTVLKEKAQIIGGIILIAIGLNIFLGHVL